MKRLQQLSVFWGWLPAFRAVAEVGGVRRAAEILQTSPSALSRAIAQLEEQVGVPLFERSGQRLALTKTGAQLLARTRQAMRGIDDALSTRPNARILQIATNHPWLLGVVEDVLITLAAESTGMFDADLVTRDDAVSALTSGRSDLLLLTFPVEHAEIECMRVVSMPLGIYTSTAAPAIESAADEALDALAYVGPAGAPDFDFVEEDASTPIRTRQVRFSSFSIGAAMDACGRGVGAGVFPRPWVARSSFASTLRCIAARPSRELHLVRRKPLGADEPTTRAAAMLEERLVVES